MIEELRNLEESKSLIFAVYILSIINIVSKKEYYLIIYCNNLSLYLLMRINLVYFIDTKKVLKHRFTNIFNRFKRSILIYYWCKRVLHYHSIKYFYL